MKKLGKTLIMIGLMLLVLDYGWNYLWGLRIEPAGNSIQILFMALPYQFNRVFSYLAFEFAHSRMELFWLGIALWITNRKGVNDVQVPAE